MAKTKIGSLRYIKRIVKDKHYACYNLVFQQYNEKGWEDIDLESLEKQAKWETARQEKRYEKAIEDEYNFFFKEDNSDSLLM